MIVDGQIVDVVKREIFPGRLIVENGIIAKIERLDSAPNHYILPGLVDAHIHIESSMLIPSQFARLAVRHGTVATISDPHEIANVCGIDGVNYMVANGDKVPFKFHFGVPSCVPATVFETAGAVISVDQVREMIQREDMFYLAEMMNWPGVLHRDTEVMAKIQAALNVGKPVDGHAPGLMGEQAETYAQAGISTDHECFTIEEGRDKLKCGMKVIIREGSAAKNYDALIHLLKESPENIMFCSDDKHPDDLILGHINALVARTLVLGYDVFDTLRACTLNPVRHYNMNVGLLQVGDPADFIVVDSLEKMEVSETWIDGICVFRNGETQFSEISDEPINNFTSYNVATSDFEVSSDGNPVPIIVAIDGELITKRADVFLPEKDGLLQPDLENDILKVCVVNRYTKAKPAVTFITNFGLKNGAIASSVAHDSHNIIAVGTSDEYLTEIVNMIMEQRGGLAAIHGKEKEILPLPVAGIMSTISGEEVAAQYTKLVTMSKSMGSKLKSPFMLISFMALLVIPELKLSDKGLFDGRKFQFI